MNTIPIPIIPIPDKVIEKATELAILEYHEATKYMIFGCEYRGEAQAVSDLVDKYVLQLMQEETTLELCKT